MKKIIIILKVIVFVVFILPLLSIYADSYRYVKVEGRQLLVDFDMDGIYQPYFIKGVGYQPYPVGRHPSDWGSNIYNDIGILERDFNLTQNMNSNTMRIWKGDDTQQGTRYQTKLTNQTLDMAEAHAIKVIAGFWVNSWGPYCNGYQMVYSAPDFTDQNVRNDYLNRFEAYVNNFKDHPAILFWAIGNENNLHIDPDNTTQIQAWYSLVNEMAQRAHQTEGESYHPVALVNGGLTYIGDSNFNAADSQMPDLDIWGVNSYANNTFGGLFNEFTTLSAKPMWLSEYGIDAWHVNDLGNPDDGYEDQQTQSQKIGNLWDEIVLKRDVNIGAALMEYSDEWWKPWEWLDGGIHNSEHNHFGYGPKDTDCPPDGVIDWWPQAPDSFFNEEWWGIMAIEDNGSAPDIMHPRLVYGTLQNRFECGYGTYYAGPENGKSCDGTHSCCSQPNMKSKNGSCVYSCGGGTGCFLKGTKVLMADGTQKPIENIRVGDIVFSFDEETKNLRPDRVTEIFRHPKEDIYLVINGKLKVTPTHLILSKGKWVSVGELKVGDTLTNVKGEDTVIKKIVVVKRLTDVYNFQTNPYHTYVADGFIVHNKKSLVNMVCHGGDCSGP